MEKVKELLSGLKAQLVKWQNPKKAQALKKYLQVKDNFYGIDEVNLNQLVAIFHKKNPTLEKNYLFQLVNQLWSSRFYEEKTLAIKLLNNYNSYLSLRDMVFLEKMLKEASTLTHVDEIACQLVATILLKNKKAFVFLQQWSFSPNCWFHLLQKVQFLYKFLRFLLI